MRILVLKKSDTSLDHWTDAFRRAGHDLTWCPVDREADLLAAMEKEWDLILPDDDPIATIDQLRRLVVHLRSTHEAQSAAVKHRLHNDVGQSLTKLKIDLAQLGKSLGGARGDRGDEIRSMESEIDNAFNALREIMALCKQGVPENLELQDVIEWRARAFEIESRIRCIALLDPEPVDVGPKTAAALIGILDEALDNAARHSDAREVKIKLGLDGAALVLSVEDDGKGISRDAIAARDSFGLFQMKELALGTRGSVVLNKIPSGGTIVKAFIPMEDRAVTPSPERETTR